MAQGPGAIIKLTGLGGLWIREDCVQLTHEQIDGRYFTFDSFEEATRKVEEMTEQGRKFTDDQKRKDDEHQRRIDEEEASEEFIRNTLNKAEELQLSVFKNFMKEIVFIDTKILNKSLFAVTLNKRFKGFLYKVENDAQFLKHVSVNQMNEVLEMILSRR